MKNVGYCRANEKAMFVPFNPDNQIYIPFVGLYNYISISGVATQLYDEFTRSVKPQ